MLMALNENGNLLDYLHFLKIFFVFPTYYVHASFNHSELIAL